MKFILALFLVLITAVALADYLGCDVVTGFTPTQSQIEVTPPSGTATVVPGIATVSAGKIRLLDLTPYVTSGAYKFRVKWADATGWWSDYTPFFSPNKAPVAGALGIVQ